MQKYLSKLSITNTTIFMRSIYAQNVLLFKTVFGLRAYHNDEQSENEKSLGNEKLVC
jgi:hypothetical protein